MRNSFKALLFAATIILSASCFRDYSEPGPVDRQVSDGPVEIQLMLNAPGEFTQAETRAMTYAQENTISDVRVLVFDQTGKLTSVKAGENVADKTATQTTPSTGISGGGSFSVMLDPSMGGGTSNLVVLTNLAGVQGAVAAVEGLAVNTSYADAMSAVFGNVSAPLYTTGGTIPMWGETGQISISPSNAQQNVKLLRSVARIDVGVGVPSRNSANDAWTWSGKNASNQNVPFKLTGVYVMRPNDRFAVAPAAANVSGGKATAPTAVGSKFTAAVSSTTFNYAVANELFTTRSIYTPEAEVIMNGTQGDSNHKERMAIVVCGFYGSDATPSYYRLDFAKGGNLMNVLRNRLYQFNITKVSGSGYGSAIEAYEANAMNMTAEIYSWDEEEISDFQFDGTYRFGVSTRSVEFSAAGGETRTIVIDTNVPAIAFSLAGAKEMQTGDTFDGSYENENYKYTLVNTASEQYTLTVESKRSYIVDTADAGRLQTWSVSAGRMNLSLTVDQLSAANSFGFAWNQGTFSGGTTPAWSAAEADNTQNYIFPWNATVAEFKVASTAGLADQCTTEGKNGGTVAYGTQTSVVDGVTTTPVLFTFNNPDYRAERNYVLKFAPTATGVTSGPVELSFKQSKQVLTRETPTGALDTYSRWYFDYKGNSVTVAPTVKVTHNVNFVISGYNSESWAQFRVAGTNDAFRSAVLVNGRVEAPGLTAADMVKTTEFEFKLDPVTTMSSNSIRQLQIKFANNDRLNNNGVSDPSILNVYQYNPYLRYTGNSFPAKAGSNYEKAPVISASGRTVEVSVQTNIQNWGVKIYSDRDNNGNSITEAPVFTHMYTATVISPVNPQNATATFDLPTYNGTEERNLRVVVFATDFPGAANETPVLSVVQKGYVEFGTGGGTNLLYMDASGRLKAGKFNNSTVKISNMVFAKSGGVVGFSITDADVQDTAWDNSRVVFNPTTKSVTSYGTRNSGTNTFPQLPGITHEMKTANETLNLSTSAYHNATNLANGRGDICRLIGLTQAEARSMLSAGTLADYRSGWRLPTDVESHDLLGRPANWSEIWVPSDYYITSFKDNEYAFLNTQAGRTALNTTQAGTPAQPKTISFPFVTRPGRPAFSEHLPLVPGRLYDGSVNYGGGFASALARSNGAPSIYISPYASSIGQVSLSPTDEYPAGYGFAIRCVRDLD